MIIFSHHHKYIIFFDLVEIFTFEICLLNLLTVILAFICFSDSSSVRKSKKQLKQSNVEMDSVISNFLANVSDSLPSQTQSFCLPSATPLKTPGKMCQSFTDGLTRHQPEPDSARKSRSKKSLSYCEAEDPAKSVAGFAKIRSIPSLNTINDGEERLESLSDSVRSEPEPMLTKVSYLLLISCPICIHFTALDTNLIYC